MARSIVSRYIPVADTDSLVTPGESVLGTGDSVPPSGNPATRKIGGNAMRKVKWLVGTKRRAVLTIVVAAMLIAAASAAAAWLVYTGLSGSAKSTTFSNSANSNVAAIVVTPSGTATPVEPGIPGNTGMTWTNNSSQTVTVNYPLTYTFTTSDDATDNCKAHLSMGGSWSPATPATMTAGQSIVFTGGTVVADPSTPIGCKNATINIAVSGTTTP